MKAAPPDTPAVNSNYRSQRYVSPLVLSHLARTRTYTHAHTHTHTVTRVGRTRAPPAKATRRRTAAQPPPHTKAPHQPHTVDEQHSTAKTTQHGNTAHTGTSVGGRASAGQAEAAEPTARRAAASKGKLKKGRLSREEKEYE